jgi:hypothetical protein
LVLLVCCVAALGAGGYAVVSIFSGDVALKQIRREATKGDPKKALSLVNEFVARHPRSFQGRLEKAQILFELSKYSQAAYEAESARELATTVGEDTSASKLAKRSRRILELGRIGKEIEDLKRQFDAADKAGDMRTMTHLNRQMQELLTAAQSMHRFRGWLI